MFNTKRTKALEEKINSLLEGLGLRMEYGGKLFLRGRHTFPPNFHEIEKHILDNPLKDCVSCSTCKCLIKKEDAIRGKSEIVRKDMAISESCGDKKYGTFIEELVTPYYCHNKDCKPKK